MDDLDLDKQLESQEPIAAWVKGLPEEELPLAWRSELNEKLLALAPHPNKKVWTWLWKPVAGLGLASVFFVAMFAKPSAVPTAPTATDTALAQAMIEAHKETVSHQVLGTVRVETVASDSGVAPLEWSDADLTTL